MSTVIKLKRGSSTPTASDIINGEVAIDTLARKFYVNDAGTIKSIGNTGSFNIVGDDSTEENVTLGETLNVIGGTGISTSTSANALTIDVDNSVVTTDGSQTLTNKTIGATSVSGDIVPTANEVYDLGSSSNRFRDLYLSGNTIHIGNVSMSFGSNTLTITDSGGGAVTLDTTAAGSILTADGSGDTTISNDLTVTGNLTVSGTTTTVDSTNTTITDNLIELNSGVHQTQTILVS